MQLSLSAKWLVLVLCLVVVGPVAGVSGQEKKPAAAKKDTKEDAKPKSKDKQESPESPSDVKTKPKTIKLSGTFEATTASEVTVGSEHLSHLEIKRIVQHGERVDKGQTIASLETEEIDKQIKDAEDDFALAKLTMDTDEFAHKQFLKTQELDRQSAERNRKAAQQAFDNFVQVDKQRQIESAKQNLKSSKAAMENAAEELKQLEQMYKEDDLTEESEEIVLKRAKQSVEYAKFRLRGTEISTNRSLSQTIPQAELQQKDTLERALMTYRKTIQDLGVARTRHEIELRRKRVKFKDQEDKLKALTDERSRVTLRAANSGIVFYGKLNRGKLSDKPSPLKEGDKVTADQVIATVVDPNKLHVRMDLAEKDLTNVVAGATCKILPTAFPKATINGVVKSVASVPYVSGKYDCVVTFRKAKSQPAILPTMACSVQFEITSDEEKDK